MHRWVTLSQLHMAAAHNKEDTHKNTSLVSDQDFNNIWSKYKHKSKLKYIIFLAIYPFSNTEMLVSSAGWLTFCGK